ncbi:MAG: ATP-binding protein [Solirubrobacteraceae bacterium]
MNPGGQELLLCSPLPRDRRCGEMARRLVERCLRDQRLEALTEDASLLASELVNNAYLHGTGNIEFSLQCVDHQRLRIQATDQGTEAGPITKRVTGCADIGGRGLQIIEQVAIAWGVYGRPTRVWAELPLAMRS